MKGFGDVVVGAGVEAFDLILPAIASREDQDRERFALLPQPPDDIETADLRQAEIDDGEVDGLLETGMQTVLPVGSDVYCEAGLSEVLAQVFPNAGFIFDDEDTHETVPVSSQIRWKRRRAPSRPGPRRSAV